MNSSYGNDVNFSQPSPVKVEDTPHQVFAETAVDNSYQKCEYCGSKKKVHHTVSIDTVDLDTHTFVSKSSIYKTVAVDTSDLDMHYEFYRYEPARSCKSVATDTYDLCFRRKELCQRNCSENYINQSVVKNYCNQTEQDTMLNLKCCSKHDSYKLTNEAFEMDLHNRKAKDLIQLDRNDSIGNLRTKIEQSETQLVNYIKKEPKSKIIFRETLRLYNANQLQNPPVENHSRSKWNTDFGSSEHNYNQRTCLTEGDFDENQESEFMFECNICKSVFNCKQILSDHLTSHEHSEEYKKDSSSDFKQKPLKSCSKTHVMHDDKIKLKSVKCEICMKYFHSSKTLYKHARLFHKEMKLKTLTDLEVSDPPMNNTTIKEHETYNKKEMKLEANSHLIQERYKEQKENLDKGDKHHKKHTPSQNGEVLLKEKCPQTPIECLTCGKVFRCWSSLKNHETVHTGERNFVCELCNKAFPTKACLKSHGSTHTGLKPFVCTTCNKAFAHKDSLRTHIRTHTGERPFKCDMCNLTFNRSFTLNMHKRTHTGEKKHICSSCGQAFTTNSALKSHERRKHSALPPPKVNRVYKQHVKDVYICDVCGKVCTSSANLRFHSANHTGIKPFACTICDKAYPMKQTLQRHMMKHTGERPFVCDICGVAFYRSTTLNIHKLRHTGERPHVCSLCGKGFIQSSSLSYHMRNHNRPPKQASKIFKKRKSTKNSCKIDIFQQMPDVSVQSKYNANLFSSNKSNVRDGNGHQEPQGTGISKPQTSCKLFVPISGSSENQLSENPFTITPHC